MANFRTTQWRNTAIWIAIAIVLVIAIVWWAGAFDRAPEAPATQGPQPETTQPQTGEPAQQQ